MGGEKSAVLWAGPVGENNSRPIRTRESVYISSLCECGRVGGIYLHHKCLNCNRFFLLSCLYFNVFDCQRLFLIYI